MSEERPSTNPVALPPGHTAGVSDSTQAPGSVRHRDPGRVPAIPGLIAPRFVSRGPLDASPKGAAAVGEMPGLLRPQLPYRKPTSTPPAADLGSNPESSAAADLPLTDSSETAAPPPVAEQPLLQQRPARPGVPVEVPLQQHRPAAAKLDSTLTAMRIISIGVEDDPVASESTYSDRAIQAPDSTSAARAISPSTIAHLPELDEAQLFPIGPVHRPQQSLQELAEVQARALPRTQSTQAAARATDDSTLPSFDLAPDAPEQGTPTAQLPSFELRDSAAPPPAAAEPETPLPSFELLDTDGDEAPTPANAVERLPSFDLEPPETGTGQHPPASVARLPITSSPPRPSTQPGSGSARGSYPSAPSIEVRQRPLPAAPRPRADTVVLSDEDLAPDSGKPAPPTPPSRSLSAPRGQSEVSVPPGARLPATAPVDVPRQALSDPDTQASAKRSPPRPPQRRSFPVPTDAEQDATSPAASKSRASDTSEAATEKTRADDKARTRRPWWEELFNEDFSRALNHLSEAQIRREATFIEVSLGVAPGGVVLDLGCGAGYHAVELAQRGYAVVGYDLSLHQLALAADVAQEKRQKLNFMHGDMREMAFDAVFDGIYCWDTTFGYFEEEKNLAVAARVFQALKPGGTFLVDVINRDFVTLQQPSSVWFEGDSAVCMDDMSVDFISSRLKVKRSVMLDDGRTKECHYSIRLYSLHELGKLLHEVGFRIAEASGQPSTPGVFMGQNAPRIIILAQRP